MRLIRRFLLPATLLIALVAIPVAAYEVPVNDGFVTQTFQALTPAEEQSLEAELTRYKNETSNEIAILITDTLNGEPIFDAAMDVVDNPKWRIGTAQNDNGILILAALQDREITIQVGHGLEGAVPDLVAKGIIDTDIAPAFQRSRYAEGLQTAVESLEKHIGGEYTADRYTEIPGGGVAQGIFFLILVVLQFFGSVMAQSRSWWLGGVLGGIVGVILTVVFGWWLSIPFCIALGLVFDYWISRHPPRRGRGGGFWGGMGGMGGGRGGGGFGGFGGGSFGGGGASGRW